MLLSSVKKLRLTRQYWPPSPPCCRARRARGGRMRQARGARGRWGSLRSSFLQFCWILTDLGSRGRLRSPPQVLLKSWWPRISILLNCNIVWNCPYQGWSVDEVNTTENQILRGQLSVPWVRGGDLSLLSAPDCCSHAGCANFQPSLILYKGRCKKIKMEI